MWILKSKDKNKNRFQANEIPLIICRMCVNGCGSRLEATGLDGNGQPVWNRWRKVECLRPRRRGNHGILEKVDGRELRLE